MSIPQSKTNVFSPFFSDPPPSPVLYSRSVLIKWFYLIWEQGYLEINMNEREGIIGVKEIM